MAPSAGPIDLSGAVWRKSARSSSEGQNCVEVAASLPRIVAVRDSAHPAGPALVVTPRNWMVFIRAVQAGTFARLILGTGPRRGAHAARTLNARPRSTGRTARPGRRWPAYWPRAAMIRAGLSG
jgi:hypothetical protein